MMFRDKPICKLYAFALALLFTVALAGCGGGGGTKKAAGTGTPPATEVCTPPQIGVFPDCMAPGPTDEEIAKTKEVGTKEKAIGEEAILSSTDGSGFDTGGIGGRDTDGAAVDTYTLTVSRDSDGIITAEVADTANPDADDDPQFSEAMGFANGSMQVRTMKADDDGNVVEEVVVVRTDIAAAMATDFGEDGTNVMFDANPKTENGTDYQSVDIDADNLEKIKTDGITSTGSGQITVLAAVEAVEDDPNTQQDETVEGVDAFETIATFDKADGTLKCAGATDCTVTLDADGKITAFGDGWEFTPDPGETIDVPDANYLTYGFWLKKTKDAKGVTTYNEVETFATADGIDATEEGSAGNQIGSVTGTATYEGGAAGVYVKNVTNNQGATVSATAGQFEANVTLDASFGGGGVADNDKFTIDGDVTNFTLHPTGGTSPEENDWEVKLNAADFSSRAEDAKVPGSVPGSVFTNDFEGTATGDSTAAAGKWNGAFWGAAGGSLDHDDDTGTDAINQHPSAVTGEFNANFTDGTAAGGFGANIKK